MAAAYARLPTDMLAMAGSTVNSMGQQDAPDLTVGEAWEEEGLCGCCARGRGCAGFGRVCYFCLCPICAQFELSSLISRVKGERVSAVAHALLPVIAAGTPNSADDQAVTFLNAFRLQENFREKIDCLPLVCMTCACAPCAEAWAFHTASGIEARKRRQQ